MHFDALTLAAAVAELDTILTGGRVQQVIAPDTYSIGLEVYAQQQRRYLLLSADPRASRLHLVSHKLRRGTERHSPLLLQMRKRVRGARLSRVEQPLYYERVAHLHFEHPEFGEILLIIEPMGRSANLILTAPDGRIMDSVRRVRPSGDAGRVLLPNKPYEPPPQQSKLSPLDDGSGDYYARLGAITEMSGSLWRALVASVAGVSPTQARELAWRAAGDRAASAQDATVMALAQALQELWAPVESGRWQPGLVERQGQPTGFAPYVVHSDGEWQPADSMSEALETYFAQQTEGSDLQNGALGDASVDEYAALRGSTARLVSDATKRVHRQLAALDKDEPAPGEPEAVRTQAEWLLALSSQIEPRQRMLEVDLGDETLQIPLDDRYTPVEQAERMFNRAAKLERAARFIPRRRLKLSLDLEFLEQLSADLALAEDQPEIVAVVEELRGGGILSAQQKQRKRARVGNEAIAIRRYVSDEGFDIFVGRSARQNEVVTFKMAHPQDFWLHARGAPGAHVVIHNQGRSVEDATLQQVAQLAAYYSKLRGERAAPVIVAERRFVTRARGGRPGQVHVRNDATITAPAELPDLGTD